MSDLVPIVIRIHSLSFSDDQYRTKILFSRRSL